MKIENPEGPKIVVTYTREELSAIPRGEGMAAGIDAVVAANAEELALLSRESIIKGLLFSGAWSEKHIRGDTLKSLQGKFVFTTVIAAKGYDGFHGRAIFHLG